MIPVTQALAARYLPIAAEGLPAVSAIMPVDAATAESPLWQRLPPGLQLMATITGRHPAAEAAAGLSASPQAGLGHTQVQLHLPNQPPQLVWMQLPPHLAAQQSLQLQVLKPATASEPPVVKWSATGQSDPADIQTLAHRTDLASEQGALFKEMANSSLIGGMASQVALSLTARQLQRWLSASTLPAEHVAVQAGGIVSHSPDKPQALAHDLKHALEHSGLFYESHLKQATLGSRPWHQLLQEPQNRAEFSAPQQVAQQLQVLEQQRLSWHGEIWPGQTMSWQLSERSARHEKAEHPAESDHLFSNLQLTLPQLGVVAVRMTWLHGRLSIRVQATDADTQQQLHGARHQLLQQLTQAGVALDGLQVSQETRDVHG